MSEGASASAAALVPEWRIAVAASTEAACGGLRSKASSPIRRVVLPRASPPWSETTIAAAAAAVAAEELREDCMCAAIMGGRNCRLRALPNPSCIMDVSVASGGVVEGRVLSEAPAADATAVPDGPTPAWGPAHLRARKTYDCHRATPPSHTIGSPSSSSPKSGSSHTPYARPASRCNTSPPLAASLAKTAATSAGTASAEPARRREHARRIPAVWLSGSGAALTDGGTEALSVTALAATPIARSAPSMARPIGTALTCSAAAGDEATVASVPSAGSAPATRCSATRTVT